MLLHPLRNTNSVITSPYGMRKHPVTGNYKLHNGVDLRAKTGTPIYSPANGVVRWVGWTDGGGNQISVNHENKGIRTGYAHLSKILVKKGDVVRRGQKIGLTGNTGRSTGPHLHFTTRNFETNEPFDPTRLDYNNINNPWVKWVLFGGAVAGAYLLYKRYGK